MNICVHSFVIAPNFIQRSRFIAQADQTDKYGHNANEN